MVRGRYVIENDQILFSSQHGLHAGEIKQFALEARSHPRPVCTPLEGVWCILQVEAWQFPFSDKVYKHAIDRVFGTAVLQLGVQ